MNGGFEYGTFIKTSKLTGNLAQDICDVPHASYNLSHVQELTDDELFKACGGRTVHKGARHGLKLSGKLSRIEKQEKMLLKKMRKVSLSDNEKDDLVTQKKLKKLKKQKDDISKQTNSDRSSCVTNQTNDTDKKRKKRKSVSFNETVTKIYTVDPDTSYGNEIGSIKDENSNDPNLENLASGSDEGKKLANGLDSYNMLIYSRRK